MERSDGVEAGARKVALVTGASQGLGRAIAVELARSGVDVAVTSRRLEACEEVAAEINAGEESAAETDAGEVDAAEIDAGEESAGEIDAGEIDAARGKAKAFACDVADGDEVRGLVNDVVAHFGRLDILVNNAGMIEPIARLGECDPLAWERNVRVNLLGPFHAVQAVLPHFGSAGGGVIVNISSGAAHGPKEGWSAYCSSKAALAMLTAAIAEENPDNGVLAFGFQPGVVDTEMQVKIRASGVNEVSRIPRERLAAPERPARLVALLCTHPLPELNGQDLSIRDAEVVAAIEAAGRRNG
ncbi:MAG TPA: SDR family oxidoreductase [Trueperaceae bacterium]